MRVIDSGVTKRNGLPPVLALLQAYFRIGNSRRVGDLVPLCKAVKKKAPGDGTWELGIFDTQDKLVNRALTSCRPPCVSIFRVPIMAMKVPELMEVSS